MYPYLDIGPVHLGMFGLLLWLAAVAGTVVLHKNFNRNGVDADALNVVALVVVAGVVGANLEGQENFYNTIYQAGGYVVSPDGKQSGYDDPKTIAGLKFWTDLIAAKESPSLKQMTDTAPPVSAAEASTTASEIHRRSTAR